MSVDDMAKDLLHKLGKGPAMSVELGKPKEVGKLEKPRAKGVLKRPAAKTPVKTNKRAAKVVAIRRGERVLVNKDHFIASSDDE